MSLRILLILAFSLSACGGESERNSVTVTAKSVSTMSGGEPRQIIGSFKLEPTPITALLADAPAREASKPLLSSIGESQRLVLHRRAASSSTPDNPQFEPLDVAAWSRAAGIYEPPVTCSAVLNCQPAAERLNLEIASLQETTGLALLSVDDAVQDRVAVVRSVVAADPNVLLVESDARISSFFKPNDPEFSRMWALHEETLIQSATGRAGSAAFEAAWDRLEGGIIRRAVVAVVDTGWVPHPDLGNPPILQGTDLISDASIANDGDARDGDATDPGDGGTCDGAITRSSWHGTHVMGSIAAIGNNSYGIVGAGLDAVSVLPIRVLGLCGGFLSDAADGIVWAAGGKVASKGDSTLSNANPADVINLSLGGVGPCPAYLQTSIDFALSRGATIVVAAGNTSEGYQTSTPANCHGVIAVGANDKFGRLASFSNFGEGLALLAPGVEIISTVDAGLTSATGPALAEYSGTSMAAAHVSAAIGLLKSLEPTLAPGDVARRLSESATPFAGVATECISAGCGAGYLNAFRLLEPTPAQVSTDPPLEEEIQPELPAGDETRTEPPPVAAVTPPREESASAQGGSGAVNIIEVLSLSIVLFLGRARQRRSHVAPSRWFGRLRTAK